ncbi:hypothetical protein HAX54_015976 [Datura stramonium]|uniref:Uncharacterized protein n=1 Tax=Datura stramonium TaxID=4076 RepID=A0ABS8UI93_DATST|nr:hypothetical protein [Datura stramonium]
MKSGEMDGEKEAEVSGLNPRTTKRPLYVVLWGKNEDNMNEENISPSDKHTLTDEQAIDQAGLEIHEEEKEENVVNGEPRATPPMNKQFIAHAESLMQRSHVSNLSHCHKVIGSSKENDEHNKV